MFEDVSLGEEAGRGGSDVVMYSTSWCPDCHRAKHFFAEYGILYKDVDVEENEDAAEVVRQLNNGSRVVPTIVFTDGTMLVEPSYEELAQKFKVRLSRG